MVETVKMGKRAAYLSYMFVRIMAGEEAAQSMGIRDFLLKRSLTAEEVITAAADGERPMVLRGLTQIKGRVKPDSRNYMGQTALMSCIEASTKSMTDDELRDWDRSQRKQQKIKFLVRLHTPGDVGDIRKAREAKYSRVMELLLAKGSDINAKCIGHVDEDVTALHIAAAGGSLTRCKWLLGRGANVNSTTENLMTPLHFAAKHGMNEAIMYLLTQDANPVARSDIGWTPLHYAAASGGTKAVKILLKAGIDKNIKDLDGHTAAEVAQRNGMKTSFQALRKYHSNKSRAIEYIAYLEKKLID